MTQLPNDQEQVRRVAILVHFGISLSEACSLNDDERLRLLMMIYEVEGVDPKPPRDAGATVRGDGHERAIPKNGPDTFKNYPPTFSHPKPTVEEPAAPRVFGLSTIG